VIVSRAHEDAEKTGWTEIPFGMECEEAVKQTRKQVKNIPNDVKRIVMVVGSGMSLSGVLHGLNDEGLSIPVVGISVGADPEERLNTYAPKNWREMVTIIKCPLDYHDEANGNILGDIILDPIYEGKCLPYLEPGDLFWVVGVRQTSVTPEEKVPVQISENKNKSKKKGSELIPVWRSEVPEEKSDMVVMELPWSVPDEEWKSFSEDLSAKIDAAVSNLKDGRMACVLFEDISDSKGFSRGLFFTIVREFEKCGMKLYNEALLVVDEPWFTSSCRNFEKTRKNHRIHRTFLTFFKGELKAIKSDFGMVDLSGLEQTLVSDPSETSEMVELE
jgi:hypothetical protein